MSFRDNLQYLRASHSMTQEQLAMLLGVSRQSVTKWEAERSYPEMDKLLKLCTIFDCTLDDLVLGDVTTTSPSSTAQAKAQVLRDASTGPVQDVCGYDQFMTKFARMISLGVFAILLGIALLMFCESFAESGSLPVMEAAALIPLLIGIAVGVGLLVIAGMDYTTFQRNHPFIQDFYGPEDRRRAQHQFSLCLIVGLVCIFMGIVIVSFTDGMDEATQMLAASIMFGLIAVGVLAIIYGSLRLSRLNISNYNAAREEALAANELWEGITTTDVHTLRSMYTDEQLKTMLGIKNVTDEDIERAQARLESKYRNKRITGGLCAMIMVIATLAGLVMLFVPGYTTSYFWMSWVVGGLLCAVAAIFVNTFIEK